MFLDRGIYRSLANRYRSSNPEAVRQNVERVWRRVVPVVPFDGEYAEDTFDARIDLGPTPFVLAGLLALAIAIGTVSGHALRVSRTNPIHALRYE